MILNNFFKKSADYAPGTVRMGVSLVFIWFGITQLMNPAGWTRLLPSWTSNLFISQQGLIVVNGVFEVILGLLLLLGIFTRVSAFLLTLHLLSITINVGYSPTGVRDFGLTLATLAVFLYGEDKLCLDSKVRKLFSRKKK